MDLKVHIKDISGTQMAAKITGTFSIDNNSFEFTAIAFGRIGGQNIGVKLPDETKKELEKFNYDVEQIIDLLQADLIQGNLTLPEGLKRETFVDD